MCVHAWFCSIDDYCLTLCIGTVVVTENATKSSQGSYSCVAVNSAGSSREVATLSLFGKDMNVTMWVHVMPFSVLQHAANDNVVRIIIRNFKQTSSDGTCHYLDPDTIEVSRKIFQNEF